MKKWIIALVILSLIVGGFCWVNSRTDDWEDDVKESLLPPFERLQCDNEALLIKVRRLSEDEDVTILKIYSDTTTRIDKTDTVLDCRAEAQTTRGRTDIDYHYEIDADGDAFYGYRIR